MQCCNVEHEKTRFYETKLFTLLSLCLGLVSLVLAFLWDDHIVGHDHFLRYLNPGWIAVVMCGIPLVVTAFENLFKFKKIKSSLLITVALLSCIALEILSWCGMADHSSGHTHSYLFAAGEVAFLMLIGEMIEESTVKKSRAGIEKLLNLAPEMADILMMGKYVSMPVSFVQVGDTVRVKPHDQISVDGTVSSGSSAVNTSPITGESIPQDVTTGDKVYAGTWNQSGTLEICVSRKSDETTVAKMIKMVKEAETNRAPIARTADRWASYIVPSAITLSVVVFIIVLFIMNLSWQTALVRAVTILVVFCPCSLALATPTAIAAAIGNATKRGVLIKSGLALETLAKVNTYAFDKTGTLTKSEIVVKHAFSTIAQNEFLKYVGSAESDSEHPLARAITQYASELTSLVKAQNTLSLVGVGVQAEVDGHQVAVVKYDSLSRVEGAIADTATQWLNAGYTVVACTLDGVAIGILALSDSIREGAKQCIDSLNQRGFNTLMLTGDNQHSAALVADKVDIKQYKSGLLPEDKVEAIESAKLDNKVCMIGDGVNDAPSLASADVSIVMGVMGSDVALEIADIALMTDRIEKIPYIAHLAKKTYHTIVRNILIGMGVNLVSVILSLFGILNPVWGALVHNASSVFVVFSASLLLLTKEDTLKPKKNLKK